MLFQFSSLEYWAFELLVLLAGLMPDAENTTSLIAIWYSCSCPVFIFSCLLSLSSNVVCITLEPDCWITCWFHSVNTEAVTFMLTYGFSAAVRYVDWAPEWRYLCFIYYAGTYVLYTISHLSSVNTLSLAALVYLMSLVLGMLIKQRMLWAWH